MREHTHRRVLRLDAGLLLAGGGIATTGAVAFSATGVRLNYPAFAAMFGTGVLVGLGGWYGLRRARGFTVRSR